MAPQGAYRISLFTSLPALGKYFAYGDNCESNQHVRRISQKTRNSRNETNRVNNFPGQAPRFIGSRTGQMSSSTIHRLQLSLWRVRAVERTLFACPRATILEHRRRLSQNRSAPRLLDRSRAFCIHHHHRSSSLDQQPARADRVCACDHFSLVGLNFRRLLSYCCCRLPAAVRLEIGS